MKLFDISPLVSEKIAVYPGDSKFQVKMALDCRKGDHLTLSSISSTVHLGAHADGPIHYSAEGQGIGEVDLSYYLGPCQVISVPLSPLGRIRPKDLNLQKIQAPRVLFKTLSFPDPNTWNDDFGALSPELIHWLGDQKVILVGIDTPSIDLSEDKVLATHHAVLERNMAILEGLVLSQIPDGLYTLIALPLRLSGLDASPVRAVLVPKTESFL